MLSWSGLAGVIHGQYALYSGFVVLHGTDTMTFAAAALSFLFDNLTKPIVFTGSQVLALNWKLFMMHYGFVDGY